MTPKPIQFVERKVHTNEHVLSFEIKKNTINLLVYLKKKYAANIKINKKTKPICSIALNDLVVIKAIQESLDSAYVSTKSKSINAKHDIKVGEYFALKEDSLSNIYIKKDENYRVCVSGPRVGQQDTIYEDPVVEVDAVFEIKKEDK